MFFLSCGEFAKSDFLLFRSDRLHSIPIDIWLRIWTFLSLPDKYSLTMCCDLFFTHLLPIYKQDYFKSLTGITDPSILESVKPLKLSSLHRDIAAMMMCYKDECFEIRQDPEVVTPYFRGGGNKSAKIYNLAMSTKRRLLAHTLLGTDEIHVHSIDAKGNSLLFSKSFEGGDGNVTRLDFSPSGHFLLVTEETNFKLIKVNRFISTDVELEQVLQNLYSFYRDEIENESICEFVENSESRDKLFIASKKSTKAFTVNLTHKEGRAVIKETRQYDLLGFPPLDEECGLESFSLVDYEERKKALAVMGCTQAGEARCFYMMHRVVLSTIDDLKQQIVSEVQFEFPGRIDDHTSRGGNFFLLLATALEKPEEQTKQLHDKKALRCYKDEDFAPDCWRVVKIDTSQIMMHYFNLCAKDYWKVMDGKGPLRSYQYFQSPFDDSLSLREMRAEARLRWCLTDDYVFVAGEKKISKAVLKFPSVECEGCLVGEGRTERVLSRAGNTIFLWDEIQCKYFTVNVGIQRPLVNTEGSEEIPLLARNRQEKRNSLTSTMMNKDDLQHKIDVNDLAYESKNVNFDCWTTAQKKRRVE